MLRCGAVPSIAGAENPVGNGSCKAEAQAPPSLSIPDNLFPTMDFLCWPSSVSPRLRVGLSSSACPQPGRVRGTHFAGLAVSAVRGEIFRPDSARAMNSV